MCVRGDRYSMHARGWGQTGGGGGLWNGVCIPNEMNNDKLNMLIQKKKSHVFNILFQCSDETVYDEEDNKDACKKKTEMW